MLRALTDTSVDLQLDGRWVIDFEVLDDDSEYVATEPVIAVTVTDPSGNVTNPTAVKQTTGIYRVAQSVSIAGRYVATINATGYGTLSAAAYVSAITTGAQFPTFSDVKTYLGTNSYSDPAIEAALDAEASAQRQVCDVPAIYPADLKEALMRRTARNLAMRGVPMAVLRGDAENGSLTLPGRDPEVRRLEAPYRKVVLI